MMNQLIVWQEFTLWTELGDCVANGLVMHNTKKTRNQINALHVVQAHTHTHTPKPDIRLATGNW